MTVGFEVYNEAEALQVGTGNPALASVNFVLRQKVTTNLAPVSPYTSGDVPRSAVTVSYSANNPIVAFSSDVPVGMVTNSLIGSTWQATFIAQGNTTAQIKVFIFDESGQAAVPAAGQNYGLELFLEDGTTRVYNSHQPPFAIVDWRMVSTTAYQAGRTYAVVPNWHTMLINFDFYADPINQIWSYAASTSGNTVSISKFPWQTKNVDPIFITLGSAGEFSVIDVTGL